jgi:O-methyltransferase
MIPLLSFNDNLFLAYSRKKITGIVVECGVWKGGMIAAIAKVVGNKHVYHLFDSFEGLPTVKEIDGEKAKQWQQNTSSKFYYDNCKSTINEVEKSMRKSGISEYTIHKGWFDNTIPVFSENLRNPIAILRLDCDWYDSVYLCMKHLFPFVSKNGIIIIDDYYMWDGCSKAVHDYLSETKSSVKIRCTKNGVCYIIKV